MTSFLNPAIAIRQPCVTDATAVASLAARLPQLDRYASYLYVLFCDHFASTCAIATTDTGVVGFLTGYRKPDPDDTLFVWQVGVAPEAHRQGLASRLLESILARPANARCRFLETTVSPDNLASRRLFARFARNCEAPLLELPGYPAELFSESHPAEPLLRIGPLPRRSP